MIGKHTLQARKRMAETWRKKIVSGDFIPSGLGRKQSIEEKRIRSIANKRASKLKRDKIWTQEKKERIKEMYLNGNSSYKIGSLYNVSNYIILNLLRDMNVPFKKNGYFNTKNIDNKKIKELYLSGKSTEIVAKEVGCALSTVCLRLKGMGIKLRCSKGTNGDLSKLKKKFLIEKNDIISMYKGGHSVTYLGSIYKCSPSTILTRLREWKIPIRKTIYAGKGNSFVTDDGHKVRSGVELFIDNWLFHNEIEHIYEKKIDGKHKCDFYIPNANLYIEYWGIMKRKNYIKRHNKKLEIYKQLGLNLLSLYPSDNIQKKLRFLLEFSKTQRKIGDYELPKDIILVKKDG